MPWARIYQADSRDMHEVADESVDLVITSPPYWHIKDYGVPGQIGFGQSLHEYLESLFQVWSEVYRVLRKGRRLCINIGDQFARAKVYGRYKVIPLHAEIIAQAETIGFDYMGAIIWQKKTTMNPSGGANVMGSYPYPPNGIVEIDYEFILLFKKPGPPPKVPREVREASRLTKEEWKTYFSGHWRFGGARQVHHEAVFPAELPRRLIRMFSFVGETVLDPFAGSGTTLEQALLLNRNAIGYEIHPDFIQQIRRRLEHQVGGMFQPDLSFVHRPQNPVVKGSRTYLPRIQDARPFNLPEAITLHPLYRIRGLKDQALLLDSGEQVELLGVEIVDLPGFQAYVQEKLRGKQVFLKEKREGPSCSRAYVYLKNRIFVNQYLLQSGLARPSEEPHPLRMRFLQVYQKAKETSSWQKSGF